MSNACLSVEEDKTRSQGWLAVRPRPDLSIVAEDPPGYVAVSVRGLQRVRESVRTQTILWAAQSLACWIQETREDSEREPDHRPGALSVSVREQRSASSFPPERRVKRHGRPSAVAIARAVASEAL